MQQSQAERVQQAVAIAAGTVPADNETRARAVQMCQQVKESPDGWRLALSLFSRYPIGNPKSVQLVLYILEVLLYAIRKGYPRIPPEGKREIRRVIVQATDSIISPKEGSVIPNFIKTKVAVVTVSILRYDYPDQWPDFFDMMLKRAQSGMRGLEMFLVLLHVIDDDIIGFDHRRTKEEVKHINKIKDHMKKTCITKVVQVLIRVTGMVEKHPNLAKRAMKLLKEYSAWISFNIVTSGTFFQHIYSATTHKILQNDAVDALNEVIRRRAADPVKKMHIINASKVLEFCQSVKNPPTEEFAECCAALIDSVVTEAIGCQRSMATAARQAMIMGEEEKFQRAKQVEKAAMQCYMSGMQIVLRFGTYPSFKVAFELVDSMKHFIESVHHSCRHSSRNPTQDEEKILGSILYFTIDKAAYPSSYDFSNQMEDEQLFDQFRVAVEKLFKKLAANFPRIIAPIFIKRLMQVMANPGSVSHQKVESHLWFLYRLFEPLSTQDKESLRKGPAVAKVLTTLLSSSLSKHPSQTLNITILNLIQRYWTYFEKAPTPMLKEAMMTFDRSMGHRVDAVRARACYQFFRFTQLISANIRKKLLPHVPDLLVMIQKKIGPFLNRGLNTGDDAKVGLQLNDILYLCEAMGIFCSSKSLQPKDTVLNLFARSSGTLRSVLLQLGNNKALWQSDKQLAGERFSEIINMITSFTKPVIPEAKRLQAPLVESLKTVIGVFSCMPDHKSVRHATILYLHLMVSGLKEIVVPHLKQTVVLLVKTMNVENIKQTCDLINQIMDQTPELSPSIVGPVFSLVVEQFHRVLGSFKFIDDDEKTVAFSVHKRDREDVIRNYYGFLRYVFRTNHLYPALISPQNQAHYQKALQNLFQGCLHRDLGTAKSCIQILEAFVNWGVRWAGGGGGLKKFLAQDVTAATIKSLGTNLDPNDAKGNLAVLSVCQIHIKLAAAYGQDYLNLLHQYMSKLMISGAAGSGLERYLKTVRQAATVTSSPAEMQAAAFEAKGALKTVLNEHAHRKKAAGAAVR